MSLSVPLYKCGTYDISLYRHPKDEGASEIHNRLFDGHDLFDDVLFGTAGGESTASNLDRKHDHGALQLFPDDVSGLSGLEKDLAPTQARCSDRRTWTGVGRQSGAGSGSCGRDARDGSCIACPDSRCD